MLEEQLDAKGMIVRRGSLIDATLIKAQPHPPRRGEPSPDPEADWTRRGKDGHFGYKVHLSVDQGSGLMRRLALTAASISESYMFEEMVIGDEAAVFADGAYAKDARKKALRGRGVFCGIINRPWRYRPITAQQKKRNKFFSRVRRAVERVIGTLKCRYGLARCRYLGWGAQSQSSLAEGDMLQPEKDVGAARGHLSRSGGRVPERLRRPEKAFAAFPRNL